MNNSIPKYLLFLLLSVLVLNSCNEKKEGITAAVDNSTTITKEQFAENKMQLGKPQQLTFDDEVVCRGNVSAPINDKAKATSLIAGKIESFYIHHGVYVQKGAAICTIKSTEFIDIQRDYAEYSARLIKIKADYERAKSLRADNIGSQKEFIGLESEYKAAMASLNATRVKLSALGMNPAAIQTGKIYSSYTVRAPISGFVTDINAVLGQYVDMSTVISEIVNTREAELTLSVFNKDIAKLHAGQSVLFNLTDSKENLSAKLVCIGKTVNPESKTIDCIADVDNNIAQRLVDQSYVQAKIITAQVRLNALPNSAFVKSEGSLFVYILKGKKNGNYIFEKKMVHITKSNDDFSAVSETLPDSEVLVQGGSTL